MISLKELKEKFVREGLVDLKAVIDAGIDPHMATAMVMFDVENPTPEQRVEAKEQNFLELYSTGTLKAVRPITMERATAMCDVFRRNYGWPDYTVQLKRILEEAEVTNHATFPRACCQCMKKILPETKCYRIGGSYFCSEKCVKGD